MCGIVGFMRLRPEAVGPLQEDVADAMVRAVWRRGPDSEGQWRSNDDNCWLGHRRLAIVDLVTGDQPMANGDGRLHIVFNGEIYNYRLLRDELVHAGYHFRTNSDTEVLIHGYDHWGGAGLVRKLRGIFAFAIYNVRNRSLFLARDHLGVKPLHWWTDGNVFLFASEIKSLLLHPGLKQRKVNLAGVSQFLVTRYVSRPQTMFKEVYKLPEASFMEVQAGAANELKAQTYWDVSYERHGTLPTFEESVDQLDELLKNTVRMQLMADVPVGAQLSGGVDSSLIVAMMETIRREMGAPEPVKTFSVGFDVEKYNEFRYARLVADKYGTEHHEIQVGFNDFVRTLPFLCWAYDEPMGEAPGIPTYLMCQKAKETVTVMLCGEGADEQFGGYRKYVFERFSRYLSQIPPTLRHQMFRKLAALLPFKARRIRSILEILALKDQGSRFASWYGAFDIASQASLLTTELQKQVGEVFTQAVFGRIISDCDSSEELDQFMYCDIHSRLVDTLLTKGDRMSMAASVEARVPFLDPKVVEFAARLPREYRVNGIKTKILLKKLAERHVPAELIYRRKVGFTMPLTDWFVGPLRNFVKDILLDDRCLSRGYYNPDVLKRMIDEHSNSKVDREQGIWVLLALELWHRVYVDDDGSEAAAGRLQTDLSGVFASKRGRELVTAQSSGATPAETVA